MKKLIFTLGLIVASATAWAGSLGSLNIFNHLGVSLSAGTTGIGIEASTPITNFVQLRAGVAIMPNIKVHMDEEIGYSYTHPLNGTVHDYAETTFNAGFGRTQGMVIFNVYPIPKCSFFVAAGAYFGAKSLVKLNAQSDEVAELQRQGLVDKVTVEGYTLPLEEGGIIRGNLNVSSFRPYIGLGWGRSIPNKRVNFNVELGVQFHGHPKLIDINNNEIPLGNIAEGEDVGDDIQKIMDKITVWPVLSFRISGKIF